MIGLGVGIDYALFILTRYREIYGENGGDVRDAVLVAMDTAGRAVLFAGDHRRDRAARHVRARRQLPLRPRRRGGDRGPARPRRLGHVAARAAHVLRPAGGPAGQADAAVPPPAQARERLPGPGFWARWIGIIQRHPAIAAIAATALMLALAAPALWLRLGNERRGQQPDLLHLAAAYDLLAQGFGPGFNGPLTLVTRCRGQGNRRLDRLTAAVADDARRRRGGRRRGSTRTATPP